MVELPSTTWRMLAQRRPGRPLPSGLDAIWDAGGGWLKRLTHRRAHFLALAKKVLALEPAFNKVSDANLRDTVEDLRGRFCRGREEPSDVLRAFALIREVSYRQVGLKPFLVQVAGALALEANSIVEMATGEGKTLTAVMPAVVAGWRAKGCHIITANDYLAQRDAEEMAPIYRSCGVAVASINQDTDPAARRAAYRADVTYTTNKEVAADFLRDRLALGKPLALPEALLAKIVDGVGSGADRLVQRGLARAIIDEADSILVDEAVTPLIISGDAPNPQQVVAFEQAADLAGQLAVNTHYTVNQRYREVELTNSGKRRLDELADGMHGIWTGARRREEIVTQALTAQELFHCGKQYVIQEEKVVIVDEFTGRLMPDREWRDGLHQAVTAKEQLEVVPQKDTYARISFQRFFRMYRDLAGMTGTAAEAWREFWQVYHLPIVVIPTNEPCI
ncbi:MAG: preprotein translocase subunit SecA, partial [Planctomycetota bacterium]